MKTEMHRRKTTSEFKWRGYNRANELSNLKLHINFNSKQGKRLFSPPPSSPLSPPLSQFNGVIFSQSLLQLGTKITKRVTTYPQPTELWLLTHPFYLFSLERLVWLHDNQFSKNSFCPMHDLTSFHNFSNVITRDAILLNLTKFNPRPIEG